MKLGLSIGYSGAHLEAVLDVLPHRAIDVIDPFPGRRAHRIRRIGHGPPSEIVAVQADTTPTNVSYAGE